MERVVDKRVNIFTPIIGVEVSLYTPNFRYSSHFSDRSYTSCAVSQTPTPKGRPNLGPRLLVDTLESVQ